MASLLAATSARSHAGTAGLLLSAALPAAGALLGARVMSKGAKRARQDFPGEGPVQEKYLVLASLMLAACVIYGLIGAGVVADLLFREAEFIPGNSGLAVGLVNGLSSSLTAVCIGMFAASAVQCGSQQPQLLVSYTLVLVYLEAFALYGLLVGIVGVSYASSTRVDLSPEQVLPLASVSALANLGGLAGSVVAGAAMMEVGVARPTLMLKSMPPVVFSGVTGIYGLITSLVDMKDWPPSGRDCCVGPLYALSGAALTYVGYHGVKGLAEDRLTHLTLVLRLIPCQAIGFAALVYGLFAAGQAQKAGGSLLQGASWSNTLWLVLLVVPALASMAGVAWGVQRQRPLAMPLLA